MSDEISRSWSDRLGDVPADRGGEATVRPWAGPDNEAPTQPLALHDQATLTMGRTTVAGPGDAPTVTGGTATLSRRLDDELAPGDRPGDHAGHRFVRRGTLGRGGMGEVLLAEQLDLAREVAIKVMQREGSGIDGLAAFRTEARITANLDHPNVVPVHDAGEDFLVMKRVQGRSLSALLKELGEPVRDLAALAQVVEILLKVCDAVAFAHSQQVIHRDIKPGNIMVGGFGEVLLVDWGMALRIDQPISADNACGGTPGYLAPEMARGQADLIGPPSDVFLLGATLYRVLAGRAPFSAGKSMQAIALAAANDWPPVGDSNREAPLRLLALQRRAMATRPVDRGSVGDFADGLRSWLRAVDAEREARTLTAGARTHLAAAGQATSAGAAYHAYAAASAECDRALGLWPDSPEAGELRIEVQEGYVRAALAAGDLLLAGTVVATIADAARARRLDAELAPARSARRWQRRRLYALRTLTALLALTTTAAAAFLLWYPSQQAERALTARRIEAAGLTAESRRLLAEAASRPAAGAGSPDDPLLITHQRALSLAWRAYGLDAGDARAVLVAAIWAQAESGLRRGGFDLPRFQVIPLRLVAGNEEASRLEARIELAVAGRAAERQRRREQWTRDFQHITGASDPHHLPGGRFDEAVDAIVRWNGADEVADVLSGLAGEEDPVLVRLAASAIGRRADLKLADRLLPLLDRPEQVVVEEVWTALCALRDETVFPAMLAFLRRLPDDRARRHGAWLRGWGERQLDRLGDDRDARVAARDRLLVGDHAGHLARVSARAADATAAEAAVLATAAAVALHQLDQPERAAALAERAAALAPALWSAYVVGAEARRRLIAATAEDLRSRGRGADADALWRDGPGADLVRRLAGAAERCGADAHRLLPQRILLACDRGDESAGAALAAEAAARLSGADWGDRWAELAAAFHRCGARALGERAWVRGEMDWMAPLQEIERLRQDADFDSALRLCRLLGERFPGCYSAQLRAGTILHLIKQGAAARPFIDLALWWRPADAGVLWLHALLLHDPLGRDVTANRQALARMLQAQRAGAEALPVIEWRRRTQTLARLAGDDATFYRLTSAPPVSYSDWQVGVHTRLRALLEDGRGDLAVDEIARLASDNYLPGNPELDRRRGDGLRLAFDQLLFWVPALRARGWPGMGRDQLARRCLFEAAVTLCRPGATARARALTLLDQARALDAGPFVSEGAAALTAAAAGEASAASALERWGGRHRLDCLRLGWAESLVGYGRAAAADRLALLPLSSGMLGTTPLRPVADLALPAAAAARMQALWTEHVDLLVPTALAGSVADPLAVWQAEVRSGGLATALADLDVAVAPPGNSYDDFLGRLHATPVAWDDPPREHHRRLRGTAPAAP